MARNSHTLSVLEKLFEAKKNDHKYLKKIYDELISDYPENDHGLKSKILEQLRFLSKDCFIWPDTEVLPSKKRLEADVFHYDYSILKFLGYCVGQKGLSDKSRRDILDYAYLKDLPNIHDQNYMKELGDKETSKRLKKIATLLASFCQNAKKKKFADMAQAIEDYENDLKYLKETYYDGKYNFPWPGFYFL